MSLNQATINSLKALFSSMDKDELDESLDILIEETLKREWIEVFRENEITMEIRVRKLRLDPNAKRDFSILSEDDKEGIETFLKDNLVCPFRNAFSCEGKDERCVALFPEIKSHDEPIDREYMRVCPCSVLYVKDVIKIAKEAIK